MTLMKNRLTFGLVLLLTAVSLLWAGYCSLDLIENPLKPGGEVSHRSIRVEDREGRLLREFLSDRDTRSQWTSLEKMSPYLVKAALAAEDSRFFHHPGVDPLAVARAFFQNIKHWKVVSGASTITMQLVRLINPGPRNLKQKAREAILALRLEKSYSKSRILEEYLNRAPFGNLSYGAAAASNLYFGKSASNLSPAEAAFLMSLPKSPTILNPYRNLEAALKRRNHILTLMEKEGYLGREEAARARLENIGLSVVKNNFRAPHFVTFIQKRINNRSDSRVRTTINLELQSKIELLTRQAVDQAEENGISQAAVLVMDHRTREVLAWVGSADFFGQEDGQNDGVLALRQPGSAVKPFTYAAALDSVLTAASIIDDRQVEYGLKSGVYSPTNYDDRFHGEVFLRTALASSLNIPAVKVMERVGLPRVYEKMKAAGLHSLDREPDFYGLGLTLGSGDVSLLELANAYATLASGGLYLDPAFTLPLPEDGGGKRVFSEQAAYLITDILSDDAARTLGFGRDSLLALPFPAAAKTGTSKNFRDNWTVGYTSSIVVAVWAGNFDSRPMGRVSGITGAGPLWRNVMRLASEYYPAKDFLRPEGLVDIEICTESGLQAGPACPNKRSEIFIKGRTPGGYCLRHNLSAKTGKTIPSVNEKNKKPAILNPGPGEQYLYDPGIEKEFQNLTVKIRAPKSLDSAVLYVNGIEYKKISPGPGPVKNVLWPLEIGVQTFKLVGMAGGKPVSRDEVTIMVY